VSTPYVSNENEYVSLRPAYVSVSTAVIEFLSLEKSVTTKCEDQADPLRWPLSALRPKNPREPSRITPGFCTESNPLLVTDGVMARAKSALAPSRGAPQWLTTSAPSITSTISSAEDAVRMALSLLTSVQ
jgi:hypothetical protein